MAEMPKAKVSLKLMHVISAALLFLMLGEARADEVFRVQMVKSRQIEIEVFERLDAQPDQPVIHVFEIVKVGDKQKTFERKPKTDTRRLVDGHFAATLELDPPSPNFDHYEVEVRNYQVTGQPLPESFRATVSSVTAEIAAASSNFVDLRFKGSSTVDWDKFKTWVTTSAAPSALVKVTKEDGTLENLNVTKASNLVLLSESGKSILRARLNLDKSLQLKGKVTVTFPASAFPPNTTAGHLPLDLLKAPIGPADVGGEALTSEKERDKIRVNVIEAGGSYETSLKLDPDPATNETPKRKKEGSLDLRLASPTITFADRISRYATWTPAQLDALVSMGKLTGESLSTNTMRLFTQVEQVFSKGTDGPLTFFRLVSEGGINADRDLRVIEYTGIGDFRYHPGFFNRVLEKDPPINRGTVIRTEFIPFGFELGHRQVRRDPIFLADDFVRRFRVGAKFDLIAAPYFEFNIENRSWWRGEVTNNKFKNYFTTSFTFLPGSIQTNFSAGIYLSYERGSLPPFTTQRQSALKAGFRIRRKHW